jgi:hypothetical protein
VSVTLGQRVTVTVADFVAVGTVARVGRKVRRAWVDLDVEPPAWLASFGPSHKLRRRVNVPWTALEIAA